MAWTYASGGADTVKNTTQMQCNPLIIKGIMYGVSAGSQAFALDATTGQEMWKMNLKDTTFNMTSRGLTYWTDGNESRIFFAFGAFLYALDAQTAVPASTIKGEKAALTQPFPLLPEPFTRQSFTENDVNDWAANRDDIIVQVRKATTGKPFTPLGNKRTVFYPGTDGGAQWGGAAVDENSMMYVPAKENPVYSSLNETARPLSKKVISSGKQLYLTYCSACHGENREGNEGGTNPSLQKVEGKYDARFYATERKRNQWHYSISFRTNH